MRNAHDWFVASLPILMAGVVAGCMGHGDSHDLHDGHGPLPGAVDVNPPWTGDWPRR